MMISGTASPTTHRGTAIIADVDWIAEMTNGQPPKAIQPGDGISSGLTTLETANQCAVMTPAKTARAPTQQIISDQRRSQAAMINISSSAQTAVSRNSVAQKSIIRLGQIRPGLGRVGSREVDWPGGGTGSAQLR